MRWGKQYAQADREVRQRDSEIADVKKRGGKPPDGLIKARGEAITRRADAKEAAKNERGGKR